MPKESLKEAIETFDDEPNYPPSKWQGGHTPRQKMPKAMKLLRVRHHKHPKRWPIVRDWMENPEAVALLASGAPRKLIAKALGQSEYTVKMAMRQAPVRALAEREARRILNHLPTRRLSKIAYEKLSAAAINKMRYVEDLDNATRSPEGSINREFVRDITIAIFGQAGAARRLGNGADVGSDEPGGVQRKVIEVVAVSAEKGSDSDLEPSTRE